MKLTTALKIEPYDFTIDHHHHISFWGSCFAGNISKLFDHYCFKVNSNPFGIIYNPLSISDNISRVLDRKYFIPEEIRFHKESYFSYDHHSLLNSRNENSHLEKINRIIDTCYENLTKCDFLFITFGTAFYYSEKNRGKAVANCQKMPSDNFIKKRASSKLIINALEKMISSLSGLNKNLKIIFTVSPVRHIKDGIIENNLSKSVLLLAVNEIIEQNKHCYYFPSYELVMDEMRDYRYYEEDLIHPNQTAIKIIWERLKKAVFDDKTKELINEIHKIKLKTEHQPLFPESAAYQSFKEKLEKEISMFEEKNNITLRSLRQP